MSDREERKQVERRLLNAHVKEFGAMPMCQGTTGSNYGTKLLADLSPADSDLELFQLASNDSPNPTSKNRAA